MSKDEIKYPLLKNKRHMMFAMEYIETLDAPRSYMKVYPNASLESAYASASTLLSRDDVKGFIDDYFAMVAQESITMYSKKAAATLNPDRVIVELEKMAYSPDFKYPETKLKALNMLGQLSGAFKLPEEEKSEANSEDQASSESKDD